MVKVLPPIEEPTSSCESYILEKQHREIFSIGSSYREKTVLELLHSDLCGPMKTPFFGGSIYFLSFIGEFTRNIWVYFFKQKFEPFGGLKEFKAMVEKKSGHFIKVLRSDRGCEYMSNRFLDFCRFHGIKRKFTMRYTP